MFDSTALLGLFRPFRLLAGDRNALAFWSGRIAELLADWVFVVALMVTVYAVTSDIAIVALFVLLRVIPRAVIITAFQEQVGRLSVRNWWLLSLPRIPLIASLILLDSRSDLVWVGIVVVAYGLLTAIANEARAAIVARLVPRPRIVATIQLNAAVERLTFVAGPLLAAIVLRGWDADVAFAVGAAALAVNSLLVWLGSRSAAATESTVPVAPVVHSESARDVLRRQPQLMLLAGGLFTGAALAICLKVILVELATDPLERSDATLGLFLALVGAGTLVGPISVPRLLGHLPVSVLVTGAAFGIAAGIALISVVTRIEIVVLVLLGIGLISITNDMVTTTATRRLAPEAGLQVAGRAMLVAVIAGQLTAAVAVALLARIWDITDVMLAVSIACVVLMTVLFVAADGISLVSRRTARS